jgi:hypothetical protein
MEFARVGLRGIWFSFRISSGAEDDWERLSNRVSLDANSRLLTPKVVTTYTLTAPARLG